MEKVGCAHEPDDVPERALALARAVVAYAFNVKYKTVPSADAAESLAVVDRGNPGFLVRRNIDRALNDLVSAVKFSCLAIDAHFHPVIAFDTFVHLRALATKLRLDLTIYDFWQRLVPSLKGYEQGVVGKLLDNQINRPDYRYPPVCALPGCRWNQTSRTCAMPAISRPLIPCLGGCDLLIKPTYCTEDCQRKARERPGCG